MVPTVDCDTLREGAIYLDLDGTRVQLVRVIDDICCWVPVDKEWNDRRHTLIGYFSKRFRLDSRAGADAAPDQRPASMTAWKFTTGAGTYVIQQHEPNGTWHRVGERVPVTGIYLAFHDLDLVTTDVRLRAGAVFPYCAKCGVEVKFELVADWSHAHDADAWGQDYEIHHPEVGGNNRASERAA